VHSLKTFSRMVVTLFIWNPNRYDGNWLAGSWERRISAIALIKLRGLRLFVSSELLYNHALF
jgi:hypothetical protein